MKNVVGYLFVILSISCYGQNLNTVRRLFQKAVEQPDLTPSFQSELERLADNSPICVAYKAASEAMLAQTLWNPLQKYTQVISYRKLMEKAVETDPNNIEIRFLRFSIEYNLPRFLGMSEHIEEDLSFIISNIDQMDIIKLDPSFSRFIIYFMRETNMCTPEQVLIIKGRL